MKRKLIKLICTLALLGAVANTPVSAGTSNQLTLNYAGNFGSGVGFAATLGGVDLADGTAYSLTATFDGANPTSTSGGFGIFSVNTLSFVINSTTYTASSPGNQVLLMGDPSGYGCYIVNLESADLVSYVSTYFNTAMPPINAASPGATVFSGFLTNGWTGGFQIALDGVVGGLVINDLSGETTASITGYAAIPEPSTYAAIFGTVILGFAAIYRHKSKVDFD